MTMEASNGEGQAQGRPRQEGQAQADRLREDAVAARYDALLGRGVPPIIFDELSFGREDLFMSLRCVICNLMRDEHQGRRHLFTAPGERVDASQFAPKKPGQGDVGNHSSNTSPTVTGVHQTPFDPVLRQALIDTGVITPDDLTRAQQKIAAMTNQMMGGSADGRHAGDRS